MSEPTSMPEPPAPRSVLPAFPVEEPSGAPGAKLSAAGEQTAVEPQVAPADMPVAIVVGDDAGQLDGEPGPRVPERMLDECDLHSPRIRRRVFLPALLFLTACFTTFAAGVYGWRMNVIHHTFWHLARLHWQQGLEYMAAVMAVLLAHEMGHFVMTVRHRVPASFPIFIPIPSTVTGTMGAVITMDGRRANRKQLFDIGIAGPLAGLVLTVPIICAGIFTAKPLPPYQETDPAALISVDRQSQSVSAKDATVIHFGEPLAVTLLRRWLRPEISPDMELAPNALYMAGWFGLLITGLNMLPISQLDGGHVIYGLFGRSSRLIARSMLVLAIAYIVVSGDYTWTAMALLVIFLGVDHPTTADDHARIGAFRWALGFASLVIPILCFTPMPLLAD